jgi:hypothetical protein
MFHGNVIKKEADANQTCDKQLGFGGWIEICVLGIQIKASRSQYYLKRLIMPVRHCQFR